MPKLAAIILAAGKGTRMNSDTPKVLHTVCGKTMLAHVVDAAKFAGVEKTVVVVQPNSDEIKKHFPDCIFVEQKEQLGTGDAVKAAQKELGDFDGNVVILNGDCPLITGDVLKELLDSLQLSPISLIAFSTEFPAQYGRLVTKADNITSIIEFKDATDQQREIRLCNAGVYAMRAKLLFDLLAEVGNKNSKGEYYLTDIIDIANKRSLQCGYILAHETEVVGVNNKVELALAETLMQDRLRHKALLDGVTIISPDTVFLSADTKFGRNVTLRPNVVIGENVVIGDNVAIGPFAHIRPNTTIGNDAKIGNFVEIKKANIGNGAKISHLSYIGDAEIGEDVNIGAGTITCNYDGFNKHKTVIESGVFIGSNTALIAPVTISKDSIIGAGSTITQNVEKDALAIARPEQKNLADGAAEFRKKRKK